MASRREFPPLGSDDVEQFVLYRVRLQEQLHLYNVWHDYVKKGDPESLAIAQTLGVVVQVWLYSFFDPRGLDVRSLWRRVFPWKKTEIQAWAARIEPLVQRLEEFRHTTGAHFDRSIAKHQRVRALLDAKTAHAAADLFTAMALALSKEEKKRPELAAELAAYELPPGDYE